MNNKISIIVAAYNIENYIRRCLESLVNQTFKDIEIIVVNDGSTDNTLNEINMINDERIRIVSQKNRGLIEARKSGYKQASGEYVLFVDGDDWLELNSLEILYNKAKEKKYDIVKYKCKKINEDNKIIPDWDVITGEFNGYDFLKLCLLGKTSHNIWSQLIRREFIKKNSIEFPSNISYGEDLALTVLLAMNSPNICIVNDDLYFYFQRNSSLSNSVSMKVLEIIQVIDFIEQRLRDKGLLERFREEFNYLVYNQIYFVNQKEIMRLNSDIGKKLFREWKEKKINIKNNRYYLDLHKSYSRKERIVSKSIERSYLLALLWGMYSKNRKVKYMNLRK